MAQVHTRLKLTLVGLVLSTSIVSAQQATRPAAAVKPARQSSKATAQRAAQIQSLINGVAVNSDQTPLPNVNLRLRNLEVNAIDQVVTADEMGQFTFVARPLVPYVVEIVDQTGRTLAVGDVIVANPGEVAGAKVALPAGLPALAGVLGDTARLVKAAAADTGLTIVDPTLPKVSPTR